MTTALIPPGRPVLDTLTQLSAAGIVAPTSVVTDATGTTLTWTPDLSAGDQTTLSTVIKSVRSAIPSITAAEWAAIQPDIDGLITYQGLASPTLAQTVAAVKAQSRILRAILRD